MEMQISFPGGKKVSARYNEFTIDTDQAKAKGGEASAPDPFTLFLSAMGTCAGTYALYFCHEREIDTSGLKMHLEFDRNEETGLVKSVRIHVALPPGFPEKYKGAIMNAIGLCTVKRNILTPPEFIIDADIQK